MLKRPNSRVGQGAVGNQEPARRLSFLNCISSGVTSKWGSERVFVEFECQSAVVTARSLRQASKKPLHRMAWWFVSVFPMTLFFDAKFVMPRE